MVDRAIEELQRHRRALALAQQEAWDAPGDEKPKRRAKRLASTVRAAKVKLEDAVSAAKSSTAEAATTEAVRDAEARAEAAAADPEAAAAGAAEPESKLTSIGQFLRHLPSTRVNSIEGIAMHTRYFMKGAKCVFDEACSTRRRRRRFAGKGRSKSCTARLCQYIASDDGDEQPCLVALGNAKCFSGWGATPHAGVALRYELGRLVTHFCVVQEHLTSRKCNACAKKGRQSQTKTGRSHAELVCEDESCRTRFKRDVNGSANIALLAATLMDNGVKRDATVFAHERAWITNT